MEGDGVIGYGREKRLIRKAIEEIGDDEMLKILDEEESARKERAQAEIDQMIKNGILKEESL